MRRTVVSLSGYCLNFVPEANKPDTKLKRTVLTPVVEKLNSAQYPPDKSLYQAVKYLSLGDQLSTPVVRKVDNVNH